MNDEIDIEDAAPWLLLFITIAGGILRILLLDKNGLWLDETFSIWMAKHSVGDMLQWLVKIDQHPPLYYFLFHFWTELNGSSPYFARLFSVIFGTATIPIIYLIGKRMSGAVVGICAAAILAFSTINVYYAQEARMYTLLMFNASVAILALVRLLTDPRSVRPIGSQFRDYVHAWRTSRHEEPVVTGGLDLRDVTRNQRGFRRWIFRHKWLPIQTIETDLAWVAFILFSALTLYSHNTAVFLPIAVNIFVLGLMLFQKAKKAGIQTAFQAPSFANWLKAQIGIFVLWSPWVYFFIKQAGVVYQRFWIPAPTWDGVVQMLKSFLYPAGGIPVHLANGIWILFLVVLVLGLVNHRKRISQFLFLAVLFAIPILGELFVSIWRPIFFGRTLIWLTIPLFLLLAAGIAQFRFRILIFFMLGVLVTINFFSTSDYYKFYQKEDWNSAARAVAGFAENDDLVLFNSNFIEIPFNYYIETFETHQYLHVEKRGLPLDLIEDGVLEPAMTAEDVPALLDLLKGRERVFLVYSHDSYTDPLGLIPQTLASQMKLSKETEFNGGKVQLYVAP
jgi:mannosyltransferase